MAPITPMVPNMAARFHPPPLRAVMMALVLFKTVQEYPQMRHGPKMADLRFDMRSIAWRHIDPEGLYRLTQEAQTLLERWKALTPDQLPLPWNEAHVMIDAISFRMGHDSRTETFDHLWISPDTGKGWVRDGPRGGIRNRTTFDMLRMHLLEG